MNRLFGTTLMALAGLGAAIALPSGSARSQAGRQLTAAQASQVALGREIYEGRARGAVCKECHGVRGRGTAMGPSLLGPKWLWGNGSVPALAKSIREGVPHPKEFDVAMPPAGGTPLSPGDVNAVASYVWSMGRPAK